MSSTQDAAAEAAMAGAVNKMMASATAPKPTAKTTALTVTVDAPDKKSLSRAQVTVLNRIRAVASGAFDVTVTYGSQPSEEAGETQPDAETAEP